MVTGAQGSDLVKYQFTDNIHYFVINEGSARALDVYAELLSDVLQSNPDVPVRILYDNTRCTMAPVRYIYQQLLDRRLSVGAPLPLRVAYLVNNGLARNILLDLLEKTRFLDIPATSRRFFLGHQHDEAIAWLSMCEF